MSKERGSRSLENDSGVTIWSLLKRIREIDFRLYQAEHTIFSEKKRLLTHRKKRSHDARNKES